jgi:hypothetical protein
MSKISPPSPSGATNARSDSPLSIGSRRADADAAGPPFRGVGFELCHASGIVASAKCTRLTGAHWTDVVRWGWVPRHYQ